MTHDDVTGWTDYVKPVADNLGVIAIVPIVKKRFLHAEEASTIAMTPTQSGGVK